MEVIIVEYTINKLAKLSGVSTRTLRYYDEIGLLTPVRMSSNGYRIYGKNEIEKLQQILFYRELGVPLNDIKHIISSQDFDGVVALENHLNSLILERVRINLLIKNVTNTISSMKGEMDMSDKEKFEGFKQNLIDENEKNYGKEIREKYGDDTVNKSNFKVKNMTKKQYDEIEKLSLELNTTLKTAFEIGDPASEIAQKACELHKNWLCYYWDEYSKEAHMGLAQMYVDDPRFTAYYDKLGEGCTVFLRDAIMIYCK